MISFDSMYIYTFAHIYTSLPTYICYTSQNPTPSAPPNASAVEREGGGWGSGVGSDGDAAWEVGEVAGIAIHA